ncbi:wall-associated receptor kinase 3-like [Eucalyptus grandis]|uniref:wall-associated receptor kinase 3-like n=1 Tax=Eucalyptus grandis TaxID=71139 RepID=UPI00192ED754|nr:wall-associated receptor kinase 3-like [Eucalyptus grandis]
MGHWLLTLAVAWWLRQGGAQKALCSPRCGKVEVSYPYGLEISRARSRDFLLNCTSPDQLLSGNVTVLKIKVNFSTIEVSLPEEHNDTQLRLAFRKSIPMLDTSFGNLTATLDWKIAENRTCEEAKSNQSSYACAGKNRKCKDSGEERGYYCLCEDGYEGNPYDRTHGCPAIIPAFFTAVCALVLYMWRRRSKERHFKRNGGELLKHHRVQIFTKAELIKATNNYDSSNKLGEGSFGSVYRGRVVGDTLIAVKKPKDLHKSVIKRDFQHELQIVMQINHKNVVKLHGICLETRIPLLVYEYISNGTLFQHIHQNASTILRLWKNRLRIATEIALALEYMHSCAEPPIIHGDIKSVNILLDHNYSAKVSDFGTSVLISPEHSNIVATKIQGTLGYIDPEYLTTGIITIKSDVYSFGVVLVELLTRKKPTSFITRSGESINIIHYFISSVKDKTLSDIINFEAASKDEMERVGMVAEIAVKCLDQTSAKRPTMQDVAEQLAKINRELDSLTVEENNEETKCEVDEENLPYHSTSIICETIQHGTSSSLF